MEKVAIISDIHGNLPGLQAAMADVEACGCNQIVCLGDLVDGGDYNSEVVQFMRDNHIACVRGNHDEYNDLNLPNDIQGFLNTLPIEIVESDIVYTHISPRLKKHKIDHPVEAWNVFDETAYRLCFIGHVHLPLIFGERCDEFGSSTAYDFDYEQPFYLDDQDRYVISVGSLGYGRDIVPKLRYVIYNKTENSVEFRAVEGEILSFHRM